MERTSKDIHAEKVYAALASSRTFVHLCDAFGLKTAAVLDIGCGYGQYLRHFGPSSTGISIEHVEAEAARKHGVKVTLGNIEDSAFSPEPHEVIWCNNMLEHLEMPHRFLERARDWLRPSGKLILGVPVVPRMWPIKRISTFSGAMASPHINFFTVDTLTETVRRAGWRVIEARAFYFKDRLLDGLLNIVAPHIFVIAEPITDFTPSEKRRQEVEALGRFTDNQQKR